MEYNETVFSSNHMIGVDEPGPNVREESILNLIIQTGSVNHIPVNTIDKIENVCVVWGYENDDVNVNQIYNHDTGEILWDDSDNRTGDDWSDEDDTLLCSLVMWGDLESTIEPVWLGHS
tara:strand:- start:1283 stop:1639 length:357 start_codon:yes stop_codon:yes gene_type:complete